MLSRYQHEGIVWIDLESPTRDEIQSLVNEFGLSGFIAEELLLPSTKPRAEIYPHYIYLLLHFPALRHSHKSVEQEIDFVIGKHFIITTRYDTIDPLHKFSKVFEVNSILHNGNLGDHAGFLMYFMIKKLYKSVEHEIDFVRQDLSSIEQHIFSDHQVEMVPAISRSARDLLNLRQTIEPHREVLHSLETDAAAFFGEDFAPFLRALSNEYYRVHNHVMRNTDFLHELRETNNSLLSTKQNETMRIFTILAFVTFPLSLIASIFSMDTVHDPIIGSPNDFWAVMGIMGLATVAMFWYFRHKKWL